MNQTDSTKNKLNVSQTYRKTLCKIAKVPEEEFEYYYIQAMKQSQVAPDNIATVAAIMKKLYKKNVDRTK